MLEGRELLSSTRTALPALAGMPALVARHADTDAVTSEVTLVEARGWKLIGVPGTPGMQVSVNSSDKGTFGELKVLATVRGLTNQVWSFKPDSSFRPALPDGAFGATTYPTPTLWTLEQGFVQNMTIRTVDIRFDLSNPTRVQLRGSADNVILDSSYLITLYRPAVGLTAKVYYTLTAHSNFTIDQSHQTLHEAFRIGRVASNFVSFLSHDSDYVRVVNAQRQLIRLSLFNQTGFILPAPSRLGGRYALLGHSSRSPRPTPSIALVPITPPAKTLTPQGFVTKTSDPNADNVDFWLNAERIRSFYSAGQRVGTFSYYIQALPPRP